MKKYIDNSVVWPPLPEWYTYAKDPGYVMCEDGDESAGGEFLIRESASGKCLFFDEEYEDAEGYWPLRAVDCDPASPEARFLCLENNGRHPDMPGAWNGYYDGEGGLAQWTPIRGSPEQTAELDQHFIFEKVGEQEGSVRPVQPAPRPGPAAASEPWAGRGHWDRTWYYHAEGRSGVPDAVVMDTDNNIEEQRFLVGPAGTLAAHGLARLDATQQELAEPELDADADAEVELELELELGGEAWDPEAAAAPVLGLQAEEGTAAECALA
eukprot:tig00020556_g11053.t1